MTSKTIWIPKRILRRIHFEPGCSESAVLVRLIEKGLCTELTLSAEAQNVINNVSIIDKQSPSIVASEYIVKGYENDFTDRYWEKSVRHKNQVIRELKAELSHYK
jgi:hypothetical protein